MSRDIKDDRRARNDSRGSRSNQDNDDVQRAIEGLKDIPDDELQEFLADEDFNIVDTWEGDEDHHERENHRDDRGKDGKRNSSSHDEATCRDRFRRRHGGSPLRDHRDRSRRDDRRGREEGMRRDPSKSSKDIERDKMRAKRDSDSKILAEKEKAIKHLLDSDTVVPPGTEEEAIQNERILDKSPRKSRERRRSSDKRRVSSPRKRSHDRIRQSPSHRERSPFMANPERKRSLEKKRSSDRARRQSWDRRHSSDRRDRRITPERSRRRAEERIVIRRSRSRDRHRSRSFDRSKRRLSRSPGRRSLLRRRLLSKSPDRRRKRSPFINEIARQFRDEALRVPSSTVGQFGPPQGGLLPTPVHQSVPPPVPHYMSMMDPVMGMPPQPPGHFISTFEPQPPPPPISFEPVPPMHPLPHEYNAPPVMYNQAAFEALSVPSPQPVPAPVMDQSLYNLTSAVIRRSSSPKNRKFSESTYYDRERERIRDRGSSSAHRSGARHSSRSERLKTPEPPVISDSKPFEKTSLSSLLEASVSAKDSGYPVLYPGYKPEILRKCEMALRELPDEDPRLKMSGRFFYDPSKREPIIHEDELVSNSILVQRTRNIIVWDEEPPRKLETLPEKPEMVEKSTQTEELIVEDNTTQTFNETVDFSVQVCPGELDPPREEKRTVMDRLDWNVRDTNDYSPACNTEDLRWSLNNSRSWNRVSPSRQDRDSRGRSHERSLHDRDARGFDLSPLDSRDNFSGRNRLNSREQFSPNFRTSVEHQDDFRESTSHHSHDNSPEVLEDDDVEIVEESFSRESSWRGGRNKSFGSTKPRGSRGKHLTGRPFRGRGGGFRGKF